jgi:cobalt-zinc-cadmium efflux system outer membrane protein
MQAGAWPNPTIGYVGDEIAGGPINRGGEHGVFIDQTIPLGGRLKVNREALAAVAETEASRAARTRAVLISRVRTAFVEALSAQHRVDVRERLARLAEEAVTTARQRFNVGLADRPDVLAAEMASSLAALDVSDAREALTRTWQSLQSAAGDPALPPQPLAGKLEDPLPDLARDAALAAALAASPDLAGSRATVTQAERAVEAARHVTAPDLTINGGPRYNRELLEPDLKPVGLEWSVAAGVTLPLFNRNTQGVAAATSRVTSARSDTAALELRLTEVFARQFEMFITARRRADVYRTGILPKAEEAYQLYLARFREMGAEYWQVQAAQRALFEANEQYVNAVEQARLAAIRLNPLLLSSP